MCKIEDLLLVDADPNGTSYYEVNDFGERTFLVADEAGQDSDIWWECNGCGLKFDFWDMALEHVDPADPDDLDGAQPFWNYGFSA